MYAGYMDDAWSAVEVWDDGSPSLPPPPARTGPMGEAQAQAQAQAAERRVGAERSGASAMDKSSRKHRSTTALLFLANTRTFHDQHPHTDSPTHSLLIMEAIAQSVSVG